MRITKRQGIAAVVCLLFLGASCSSNSDSEGGTSKEGGEGVNDIAAADRDELVDGGKLTWPLETYPPNFNQHHLDGALADNSNVIGALMPGMFNVDAAAQLEVNPDYATSAELTATEPKQVVKYKLNPAAVWYDGTPITVADFQAQWKALNGTDERFLIVSSNGYERIESVEQGVDDREIIVTFAQPFADWQGLFGPLYPKSTMSDPAVFNDGWKDKALTTAGPFKMASTDSTGKIVTLARNEKWWGRPAKLDTIVFRQMDRDAQPEALANKEIDFIGVGSDVNRLKRAEAIAGVKLHYSAAPNFNHLTINGTSPLMSDVKVRKALVQSINRDAVAGALLGPLGVKPTPLGNHIFMTNQKGYQDNAKEIVPFDLEGAKKLLDEAGWKLEGGDTRTKDGKPLSLRLPLTPGSTVGKQVSELIRGMAQEAGIKIEVISVPNAEFFPEYVNKGNFDIVLFGWAGGIFPVTSTKSIYSRPLTRPDGTQDVRQNYARIGSEEIDKLYDEAVAVFDADQKIELGNRIDRLIWEQVHSLTFYQVPDIVAAKEKLANFGAFGFASTIYEDIGYRK